MYYIDYILKLISHTCTEPSKLSNFPFMIFDGRLFQSDTNESTKLFGIIDGSKCNFLLCMCIIMVSWFCPDEDLKKIYNDFFYIMEVSISRINTYESTYNIIHECSTSNQITSSNCKQIGSSDKNKQYYQSAVHSHSKKLWLELV